MSGARVIVGVTLRECLRRRVLVVVVLLTIAFLALYSVATHFAFSTINTARVQQGTTFVDAKALAGATLLGLAMFATLFLGAVLAVFLTFNVISGDAEQGLLQPIVVRPIGRTRPQPIFTSVDLPAPFGPSRPTSSPASTCRLTPSSATVRP